MGKVNSTRVLLGGLLAGVIIDAAEALINGVILGKQWSDQLVKAGRPSELPNEALTIFLICGLLIGFVSVWLYAAIRPRYGAGPKTAVMVALAIWLVGYVIPMAGQLGLGLVPGQVAMTAIGLGLIELIVAVIAGAWVYTEV